MLTKQLVLPLTGVTFTHHLSLFLKQALFQGNFSLFIFVTTILFFCLVAYMVFKSNVREGKILFLAAVWFTVLSFLTSIGSPTREVYLSHISALGMQRYYFVPNVFLALSLLFCLKKGTLLPGIAKKMLASSLVWILLLGLYEYPRVK
ncbi:hypothetical protein ACFLQ1_01135, partial [Candidatus Auribacterota bacterium]